MNFFNKLIKTKPQERDFSLASGERQTATVIENIRIDHIKRYQTCIDWIQQHSPETAELFGLDAFCATGYGAHMIANQLRCHILGVDASSQAIEVANSHFSTNQTIFCCKHFPFSLPLEVFDFATCIESVEHVAEYELLIESLLGSLKSGGFLFVSTPNEEILPFDANRMPFHVRHFHHIELVEMVVLDGKSVLQTFYGQNVYSQSTGILSKNLPSEEMVLVENSIKQFQLYIFQKT